MLIKTVLFEYVNGSISRAESRRRVGSARKL